MADKIAITHLSSNIFTHIIHLSDIHIRPLERHVEYQLVFDKLYESIDNLKNSNINAIIVITGDIFESKTLFHPETYEFCKKFLLNLLTRYPIIMILGNHDMKENQNRMDSLTPICPDDENFYYLRDSGAYEYGNVIFSITSLYNESIDFITRDKIETNKKCIALYHGTLSGSQSDAGHTFLDTDTSSRFRKKSEFAGYDAVLLGDIHKMQKLSDTMYYAGSLIQQNYGETVRNHGYLLWDFTQQETIVNFTEIINDYGQVNIIMNQNKWENSAISFPAKSSLRFHLTNTNETIIEDVLKVIKTKTEVISYNIRSNDEIISICDNQIQEKAADALPVSDIFISELNQIKCTSDQTKILTDIHNKYKMELKTESTKTETYLWNPLTLEFQNMFGYANDHINKIKISNGVTSISAPNAAGKTSIINILFYAIFGELLLNPGKSKTCDILNNMESKGYVKLTLKYGITNYTIVKKLKRINGINNLESTVSLLYEDNGKDIKKINMDAKKQIELMFGNMNDFYKCNVLNNRDQNNDFFRLNDGDKIKYLKQIFRLSYLDDLVNKTKDSIKQIKIQIVEKRLKSKILKESETTPLSISELEDSLAELNKDSKMYNMALQKFIGQYEMINKVITLKEHALNNILNLNVNDLNKKLNAIKQDINDFSVEYNIKELESRISYNKKQINNKNICTKDILEKQLNITKKEIKTLEKNVNCNLSKDESYKLLIDKQTQKKYLESEIEKQKVEIIKYDQKNKSTKSKRTIDDLQKEISELQKKYINTNNESQSSVKLRIDTIEKKLLDLNNHTTTLNKIYLEKELSDINKKIKETQVKTSKIRKHNAPCDIAKNDIPLKMTQLSEAKKVIHSVQQHHIINMDNHKLNIIELETLNGVIDSMLNNSISDEKLDSYINLLNQIETRETLPKKEFNNAKMQLFCPLRQLLETIKNNNINDLREKIKQLTIRKDELINEIRKIDICIIQNKEIDSVIKQNQENEKHNKCIDNEIIKYEYYKIKFELDTLLEQKKNVELQYSYSKLKEDFNKENVLLKNLINNSKIEEKMNTLKVSINQIKYAELSILLGNNKTKLEKLLGESVLVEKQYQLIVLKEKECSILNDIKILDNNTILSAEIVTLSKNIEYEKSRQIFVDITNKLTLIENNIVLEEELINLRKRMEIAVENKNKYQLLLTNKSIERNDIIKFIESKKKNDNELTLLSDELLKLETVLRNHEMYEKLIGPKGLQVKILKKKLSSMEIYINEIMEKYTKYQIKIWYDPIEDLDKKEKNKHNTSGSINVIAIINQHTLSLERLSTYETLILTIAFKRALNKHTNHNKSNVFIMDESVECMDLMHFEKVLPEMMELILAGYPTVLIISQRDITHISDQTIKIEKKNDISKIVE